MNNETCGSALPTANPFRLSSSPQYSSFPPCQLSAADRQLLTPPHSRISTTFTPDAPRRTSRSYLSSSAHPQHRPGGTYPSRRRCHRLLPGSEILPGRKRSYRRGHRPDDFPDFLNWMKGSDKGLHPPEESQDLLRHPGQFRPDRISGFQRIERIESLGRILRRSVVRNG